jgi:hypothetical protein
MHMDKDLNQNELVNLEDVEIQPLSDEDLDSVAGGCSGWCCSNQQAESA